MLSFNISSLLGLPFIKEDVNSEYVEILLGKLLNYRTQQTNELFIAVVVINDNMLVITNPLILDTNTLKDETLMTLTVTLMCILKMLDHERLQRHTVTVKLTLCTHTRTRPLNPWKPSEQVIVKLRKHWTPTGRLQPPDDQTAHRFIVLVSRLIQLKA